MLASHLYKLTRSPTSRSVGRVRYAMDPAHLQAIRNYLLMGTRAHGIPAAHAEAVPGLLPMYRQFPRAGGALADLFQHGHPEALMAYLGMAEDSGTTHPLLDALAALHGHIQPGTPEQGRIVRRLQEPFGNAQYGHALSRLLETLDDSEQSLRQGYRGNTGAMSIEQVRGMRQAMLPHAQALYMDQPMGAVHLHDLAHTLHRNPQAGPYAQRQGEMTRESMTRGLHEYLQGVLSGGR